MTELSKRIHDDIAALRTRRDELRVQASLAAMEARECWQEAERKWPEIEAKLEELGRASAAGGREIGGALHRLADSVRKTYSELAATL